MDSCCQVTSCPLDTLFKMLVFPGIIFLSVFGMVAEFIDRRLHARLQNRMGPPWFQPFADFIKLAAKQDVMPEQAERGIFKLMPILALAGTVTAFFYIPIWGMQSVLKPFEGDVIVVLYLLTIPTLTFFLAGWFSGPGSAYSMLGAIRSITQLFAYEVPLFLAILAPAMLAGTWSLSKMAVFYQANPALTAFNVIGLVVAMVALLGKLEKVPFDIPEAETEIVAGCFTEYSGRLLAMFRMAIDVEMIVGASLIAAVFLPFGLGIGAYAGFGLYLAKVLLVVCVLTVLRTVFARLRIDQMIAFCWKVVAPIAFLQVVIDLVVKGFVK